MFCVIIFRGGKSYPRMFWRDLDSTGDWMYKSSFMTTCIPKTHEEVMKLIELFGEPKYGYDTFKMITSPTVPIRLLAMYNTSLAE